MSGVAGKQDPPPAISTGYQQVRSVAAHLAGDEPAAKDVRLVLPETGICSTNIVTEIAASAGCCKPVPAPSCRGSKADA